MTVVVWDGRTLAADRRGTSGGLPYRITKLRRTKAGEVMAIVGTHAHGEMLMAWYEDGADPAKWPECQRDKEDWTRLIVASRNGVIEYQTQPIRLAVEMPRFAWGSGRDFAIMAMHLGKNAREAVELASLFDIGCGDGVDAEDVL